MGTRKKMKLTETATTFKDIANITVTTPPTDQIIN